MFEPCNSFFQSCITILSRYLTKWLTFSDELVTIMPPLETMCVTFKKTNTCLIKTKYHWLVWWHNQYSCKWWMHMMVLHEVVFKVSHSKETQVWRDFKFFQMFIIFSMLKDLCDFQIWLLNWQVERVIWLISFYHDISIHRYSNVEVL